MSTLGRFKTLPATFVVAVLFLSTALNQTAFADGGPEVISASGEVILKGDGQRFVAYGGGGLSPTVVDTKTGESRVIEAPDSCRPAAVGGLNVALDCSTPERAEQPRVASVFGGASRVMRGATAEAQPLAIGRFWSLIQFRPGPESQPAGSRGFAHISQRNLRLSDGASVFVPQQSRMRKRGVFPKLSVQNLNTEKAGVRTIFPRWVGSQNQARWSMDDLFTANAAISVAPSSKRPRSFLDQNTVLWRRGQSRPTILDKSRNISGLGIGSGRVTWISYNRLKSNNQGIRAPMFFNAVAFDRKEVGKASRLKLPALTVDANLLSAFASAEPVKRGALLQVPLEVSPGTYRFKLEIIDLPKP